MTSQLILGDSRELVSSVEADVVLTDPIWPNAPDGMFPNLEPYSIFCEVMHRLNPSIKRVVVVMRFDSDPRFLQGVPARFPFFRMATLTYVTPGYIGRKLGGTEVAYCFGAPIPSREGQRVIPGEGPKIQPPRSRRLEGIKHPSPRAVEHFEWLVRWWSEPGETVFDPFMGSCTTGVAAYNMGRKFVGIEIDPTHFEEAQQRLDKAHQRQHLLQV